MTMPPAMFAVVRKVAVPAIVSAILLMLAIGGRAMLEQTMACHMLVQIPMLLFAGMTASLCLSRLSIGGVFGKRLGAWNAHGLTGLLLFLLVTAYWMIPRALDSAIAFNAAEIGKIASLFLAGLLLPVSLARANAIIQLFFLGNFASMMAIVGLLYQDGSTRLCNFYLVDDQVVAGIGLVSLAIVVPLLWCLYQIKNKSAFFA